MYSLCTCSVPLVKPTNIVPFLSTAIALTAFFSTWWTNNCMYILHYITLYLWLKSDNYIYVKISITVYIACIKNQ